MAVADERASRGIRDAAGPLPGPLPPGASVDFGEENQTRLCGAPVKGPLFAFAPAIDTFLKAHLFGDIFGRDNLDWKTRELATVAALAAMKGVDSQWEAHMNIARRNGWSQAALDEATRQAREAAAGGIFSQGEPAAAHFTGRAWVAMLVEQPQNRGNVSAYNVTFAPGTRNDWHSHSIGQILLCTSGTGYYRERGRAARKLSPGDVVEIPADTEHWHGAGPDGPFTHIGITPRASENETRWAEPVSDAEYAAAVGGAPSAKEL